MNSEVLAPAGSLDHGLWALEGGAQAVYFGLQKFSARAHSANFTLDDVSSLSHAAREKGAKVYCAINTILSDSELREALELSWSLYYRGVDALIVQDLGFAAALRRNGPPLALHASTQTAVHNPGGAKILRDIGFSRIILAREMTIDELRTIVKEVHDVEFEVFVHGALCYAVSGNCMASGLMLGRSANRGDCAQVCRGKFQLDYLIPGPRRAESPHEEGLPEGIHAPPGEETWKSGTVGAFASMNDLELGSRVRELRDLGISSFKIEGRMKPPAYAFYTARAYRTFLEGGRDEEAWSYLDEARVRYGRLPGTGWIDGHKALAQTNPDWAGTLGLPLGEILEGRTELTINTGKSLARFRSLAKGDGVMILGNGGSHSHRTSLARSALVENENTRLTLADPCPFATEGASLWLISRHDGKLKEKRPSGQFRFPVPVSILASAPPSGSISIEVRSSAFPSLAVVGDFPRVPAEGGSGIEASLRSIFSSSGSNFVAADVGVDNEAGAVFVQPSALKALRRRFFDNMEELAQATAVSSAAAPPPAPGTGLAPPRASLSPLRGVNASVGFIVEWDGLKSSHLADSSWGKALPLAPFTPVEAVYLDGLRSFVARECADQRLFLGLSNPAHFAWLEALRKDGHDIQAYFLDWGFHAANSWTTASLSQLSPGLAFAIGWLESPTGADTSYFPPLFTSRTCMLRNSFGSQVPGKVESKTEDFPTRTWTAAKERGIQLHRPSFGPRCPADCAGHFSARLSQGDKNFRVEARDCINYLILEEKSVQK